MKVMNSSFSFLILTLIAVTLTHASVGYADGRPDRITHEGDTSPPTPSTPGDGGGSGSWSHPDRPSRDNDHDESPVDSFGGGGYYDDSGSGGVVIACAPSDIQSNVAVTDATLSKLVGTQDFASAAKFKTVVGQIAALKNPSARAAAYLSLAGIDAKDQRSVVAFVGARDARGSWIIELERRADLNERQAVSVATSLQAALRGGLN